MAAATTQQRVIALVLYTIILMVVHYFVVEPSFLPSEKALWLFNGVASLLFGSRLLNPHFTPPADAATNGFLVVLAMLAASLAIASTSSDFVLLVAVGVFGGIVLVTSIIVLAIREPSGLEARPWVIAIDKSVRKLGSPNVIYTIVILAAVWMFHRNQAIETFAILAIWAVILTLAPVEGVLKQFENLFMLISEKSQNTWLGETAAHQSPDVVLIRQSDGTYVKRGTPLIVFDNQGPQKLAVSLNYVGRDEGNLLRSLTFSVPRGLLARISGASDVKGTGVAARLELSEADIAGIPNDHPASLLKRMDQFCGIVDEGTTLDNLQFEVIEDRNLSEGSLVEAEIAGKPSLFRVIHGITREEIVQQKNKYGFARAKARKIGRWNADARKFEPVTWLPKINTPVFLRAAEEGGPATDAVGLFPGTCYTVGINISDTVTHNTAILGILGVGKSYLAIELVERMITEDVKVICLDLTDQYAEQLSDFLDQGHEEKKTAELQKIGGRGKSHQNKEEGGTKKAFKNAVLTQLREFLDPSSNKYLRIFNPTRFDVWQQTSGQFQNSAAMASLTPCEITAVISECTLEVAQEMGMSDQARICLVFEEAHSLVPEWNSVAADGDKTATAATARAILQGRKYGLGCLLITQRTANVTKTILNQCNTIFAMRTFDDTGKEFLSNYIGTDYANFLPNLKSRHAVVFGKALTCDNPVVIRLNNRIDFVTTFRQDNPLRPVSIDEEMKQSVEGALILPTRYRSNYHSAIMDSAISGRV